ncbi:hypothetical protein K7432_011993 [Basidiobolus ranarum]|uniref:FAS1 domain-containing protein n=1 Tax=Basidiobolus ranarum TaxID=34480 RepID=A0ABR2VSZ0_9FUNG
MKCCYFLYSTLFILRYSQAQSIQRNIVETVSTYENLKTLSSLLANSTSEEIKNILIGKEQYTLFAPEDLAFSSVNLGSLDPTSLGNILKYHIVPGIVKTADLKNTQLLPTLLNDLTLVNLPNGKSQVLPVHQAMEKMKIGNASIVTTGVEASNGIVHIIDTVLPVPDKPSQLISTSSTRTFSDLLIKTNLAGVIDSLKGVTIFVPVEEAFNSFNPNNLNETALSDTLKFHIVSPAVVYSTEFNKTQRLVTLQSKQLNFKTENGTSFVNGVKIITSDVVASNGVFHLIAEVLSPILDYNSTVPLNSPQNSAKPNDPSATTTGSPNRPTLELQNVATTLVSFPCNSLMLVVFFVYSTFF